MNNKNKISILISNYNKSKFLSQTLSMFKKQSYQNFEVILFDDVSDDNSLEIIKKFRNIKLIMNKKKKFSFAALNQINALNECFKISKGQIICLLDADDYFNKNKLTVLKSYFLKKRISMPYLIYQLKDTVLLRKNLKIKKRYKKIFGRQ